jgi:hypothetical protein
LRFLQDLVFAVFFALRDINASAIYPPFYNVFVNFDRFKSHFSIFSKLLLADKYNIKPPLGLNIENV